jgi:hypothetical protein
MSIHLVLVEAETEEEVKIVAKNLGPISVLTLGRVDELDLDNAEDVDTLVFFAKTFLEQRKTRDDSIRRATTALTAGLS